MRLFDEIFGGADESLAGARCVWKPDGEGYFQGVKTLVKFSPEEICVRTLKGEVQVTGRQLTVKKYADGDLYIGGKITALKVETGGGKG
ncbi:MAG: YabP/YqfC family sporulation protein [Clostridia bacterium]|nr:YabP/YqfC family sporulation protein [Clostridia bacterium]